MNSSPRHLARVADGAGAVHPFTMNGRDPSRPVHVATASDGTLTYLVHLTPEALPPVRLRDLAAAWDSAREAAIGARFDAARLFRFCRGDGSWTDLALADHDARCWAGAVDRTVGMESSYGLSLCLRLLALVDLLACATWARGHFTLRRDGAEIDRAVLHTAAVTPLNPEARFDESGFRAQVASPRLEAPRPAAASRGRKRPGHAPASGVSV